MAGLSKQTADLDNNNDITMDFCKKIDHDNRRWLSNGTEHNSQVDDDSNDDSECWDDAKALLHRDTDDIGDSNYSNSQDNVDGPSDDQFHDRANTSRTNTIATEQKFINIVEGATLLTRPSPSSTDSSLQASNNVPQYSRPVSESQSPSRLLSRSTSVDDLILHEAVFKNDAERIFAILSDAQLVKQRELVNKRDKHGNTALHLACMLGRPKDIIIALLQNEHGFRWSIDVKNLNRWTPFHEACSYGDREIISLLAKQLKDDVDDALHNSKLSDFLEKTKDYRLVLKWEFQSWVPFVSRVLPSDVCVILKQGKCIRIDTRLLDFEGLFRKKGDSCLVYSNGKWSVMNNKTKKYKHFETPTLYRDLEEKVDEFMSTDIMDLELKSSEMQLTRSTSGWIWKADKVGKVGRFNAALYDLNNVFLVTRKRREHLSEEDLKRNKSAYKSAVHVFKFGEKPGASNSNREDDVNSGGADGINLTSDNTEDDDVEEEVEEEEISHRESLPPPPPTNVSWHEYLQSEPGDHPTLGREQKCKVVKTAVKASVAMSEEFPLSKREFLDLLSIVPIKMFKKLKEFVELKLPEGFPVRLDIPVFPFLTARITFEDFAFHDGPFDESLFSIPEDYELDINLLPGRLKGSKKNDNNSTIHVRE